MTNKPLQFIENILERQRISFFFKDIFIIIFNKYKKMGNSH